MNEHSMEDQPKPTKASSIFEFTANTIDGKEVSLDKYRGNVCLVVNVASKCGLAGTNLPQLEELHALFAEQGLRILAFPCNQFANQEPGSNEEIKKRLEENYKISYDLFEKIDVNGSTAHPLFKYLQAAVEGTFINAIKWNYTKFLTDRNGVPMKRYSPTTSPLEMVPDIRKFLAQ